MIRAASSLGQDLHGKDVIIVDDMIASGESMLDVCKQLKEKGANRVFCFATFGLFTEGLEKFDVCSKEGVFDKVFTTNLIYRRPDLATRDWFVEVNMCKYVAYLIDTYSADIRIAAEEIFSYLILLNSLTLINEIFGQDDEFNVFGIAYEVPSSVACKDELKASV